MSTHQKAIAIRASVFQSQFNKTFLFLIHGVLLFSSHPQFLLCLHFCPYTLPSAPATCFFLTLCRPGSPQLPENIPSLVNVLYFSANDRKIKSYFLSYPPKFQPILIEFHEQMLIIFLHSNLWVFCHALHFCYRLFIRSHQSFT